MSTGGQMCTWDWPPWASTCPSPTCRGPSASLWLRGLQALPPAAHQAPINLWSLQSSWSTLVTPASPRTEAVARARTTSPSQLIDSMSWACSQTRPCWPSTARRECSSVPSKTSDHCTSIYLYCSEQIWSGFPDSQNLFQWFKMVSFRVELAFAKTQLALTTITL